MELVEDARPLYQCVWRFRDTHRFPEAIARHFAAQLVVAIGVLHELRYVHRDLKSGNVLVDQRGNAKIIDYGFAMRLGDDEKQHEPQEEQNMTAASICGTHYIVAPEMSLGLSYGFEIDWWYVSRVVDSTAGIGGDFIGIGWDAGRSV
ncbi:hypothetical protein P43SY_011069 [Pythium insidiosum]|uniref:Protein kinase domain-containing protein n=1 Tax=Pythium insidiosum TaxID=114742 RepID=A0AAD5L786_PYTIN|nr:hypothetical protein P43SY_011069 [Pythium insidiosum]